LLWAGWEGDQLLVLQDAMPFRLAMRQHHHGEESFSVVCMERRAPDQALDERRLALEVDSKGAW
jgi:hypothetical protein